MNYSENAASVRVDFWKESGKWYGTEAVIWTGPYKRCPIHAAFKRSLQDHFGDEPRMVGMTATCLEPYHEHAHPISVVMDETCYKPSRLSVKPG